MQNHAYCGDISTSGGGTHQHTWHKNKSALRMSGRRYCFMGTSKELGRGHAACALFRFLRQKMAISSFVMKAGIISLFTFSTIYLFRGSSEDLPLLTPHRSRLPTRSRTRRRGWQSFTSLGFMFCCSKCGCTDFKSNCSLCFAWVATLATYNTFCKVLEFKKWFDLDQKKHAVINE